MTRLYKQDYLQYIHYSIHSIGRVIKLCKHNSATLRHAGVGVKECDSHWEKQPAVSEKCFNHLKLLSVIKYFVMLMKKHRDNQLICQSTIILDFFHCSVSLK